MSNDHETASRASLMSYLLHKLMLTCREAARLTSLAMDEKLSLWQRLQLAAHTRICRWCRHNTRQHRLLRELSRTGSTTDCEQGHATLDSQIKAAMQQRINEQAMP